MVGNRAAQRQKQAFPWGKYFGLLTTSLVMLVGVIKGLDPLTILQRSLVAGFVMGAIVAVGVGLLQLLESDRRSNA